ncbi:hypothetical protein AT01_1326 [Yersinia aldovae 670-83]|nr:hypothetical protein AT01_1326 [Yersinia aldovae 670-83]
MGFFHFSHPVAPVCAQLDSNMENQNNPQGKLESAAWLIRWVDSWKKLAILIVLTLFSIASYLAYDYRREITYWALAHYGTPRIDQTKIDAEVRSMMSDTGGVTVSVWSLNLQRNQRIALYVRIREQRLSNLEGVGDLIFRPHSKLSMAVIDLLDKKTVCYDLVQSTAIGRAASAAGATYVCSAAVPPQHGSMIGLIAVGFTEKPENEDYVRQRILLASERIIK